MNPAYRWLMPAAAAFALIFVIAWAKDAAPWPIYLLVTVAFLGCVGWTVKLHSESRPRRG